MATRTMLVATQSFRGGLPDGSVFDAREGETRIWSDHPAAKRWPDHFQAVNVTHETPGGPPLEQATAAPGEKR